LQQQGKRHNGYLSVVCINNDNKGRTENECSPCERPEKNYLATSITINSDYKKIKKEVFIVAAETMAIFFVTEKVANPESVGHTVEKHLSSIFTQKKTPQVKTTFVF
jgi:hypothetical protein